MDELASEFWKRTNDLIKAQKTTQEWLAKNCNLNFPTFKGWIARKIIPDGYQCVSIAHSLGTTVEYLVTGSIADTQKRIDTIKEHFSQVLAELEKIKV